jgi:hypothetical protein
MMYNVCVLELDYLGRLLINICKKNVINGPLLIGI